MNCRIVATALVCAVLAGCAGNRVSGPPEERTLVGVTPSASQGVPPGAPAGTPAAAGYPGAGALPSPAADAPVERGPARAAPAATDAAIGSMIGNRIGAGLDDDDKQRAYAAQVQALSSGAAGAPTAWRNPDSGRYGSIVPGATYQQQGMSCRQYTHTIYIDSKPQTARGAACRNPDGSWQPVS